MTDLCSRLASKAEITRILTCFIDRLVLVYVLQLRNVLRAQMSERLRLNGICRPCLHGDAKQIFVRSIRRACRDCCDCARAITL